MTMKYSNRSNNFRNMVDNVPNLKYAVLVLSVHLWDVRNEWKISFRYFLTFVWMMTTTFLSKRLSNVISSASSKKQGLTTPPDNKMYHFSGRSNYSKFIECFLSLRMRHILFLDVSLQCEIVFITKGDFTRKFISCCNNP